MHGYSIGGAAAVGLALKKSLEADEGRGIEILIVDRSFSSIGEVFIFGFRCQFNSENICTS